LNIVDADYVKIGSEFGCAVGSGIEGGSLADLLDGSGAVVDVADDELSAWPQHLGEPDVRDFLGFVLDDGFDIGGVEVGFEHPGESALHEFRDDVEVGVDVEGVQAGVSDLLGEISDL